MPTCYTHCIEEGATFNEFILKCAEAFNIEFRDTPADATILDADLFKPSSYHLDQLNEANERLVTLNKMGKVACLQAAKKEYDESLKDYHERLVEIESLMVKYKAILEKVEQWNPPTPDHEGLKRFMISQLEDSIKHDDTREYIKPPTAITGAQWKAMRLASIQHDIDYHAPKYVQDCKDAQSSKEWVTQLLQSLKA